MNLFDFVLAALLATASAYGLIRGFVRISIGVGGLAISAALALRLAAWGPDWFSGIFASVEVARAAAFALVLAAGLLATAVAAWLGWKLVRVAQIGWLDRLAGALVGLAGAILVSAALVVAATTFLPPESRVVAESRLVPWIVRISDVAAKLLPPELGEVYRRHRERLDEAVRQQAAALGPSSRTGAGERSEP